VTQSETPPETPKAEEPPKPPAPAVPEGMVMVPAGAYTVGRDDESDLEKPQHTVTLPAYFIDRTEVTNEEYKKFVDATNRKPPANWQGKTYPAGRANYPVTGVTWQDAADYAAWAGKRLPTEAEWEAAARGPQGLRYPWGNEWLPGQANIGVKAGEQAKDKQYPPQIMEVGGFPQGASPAGALDMIGNVWEWTADELKPYDGNPATLNDIFRKLNISLKPDTTYRVIRGGAFDGDPQHDASYRGFVSAAQSFPKTGFRCVKDAK
jgi:formylglycine-generating enzyme required for sulfatase activity